MKFAITQDRILGLIALIFGLWIALYWAHEDAATGVVKFKYGSLRVGDALAPTVAGSLIAFAGLWLMLTGDAARRLTWSNVGYLALLGVCLIGGLALMRWGGPALVEAITDSAYRPLRDTFPWKYVGFILGGVVMITSLIAIVERRLHWSRILIALGVATLLAFVYDVPFDDLLLPPNGDL